MEAIARWRSNYPGPGIQPLNAAKMNKANKATKYRMVRTALLLMAKVYLLCLVIGCSAFAQIPDAPSAAKKQNVYLAPFKQPEFYISVGAFSSSAIYDVNSTKVCEANRTCVEAYKGHDRYGYYTPLVGLVAAGTYGCQLMLHEHKWWRRFACSGIGIGLSIQHWKDGSTIYHEDRFARP